MILNIVRLWQGLFTVGPTYRGGPDGYFYDVSHYTFVFKSVLYNLQTIIFDGVVVSTSACLYFLLVSKHAAQVYRAYAVWQNIYVVIIPILGWIALVGKYLIFTVHVHVTQIH